MNISPQKLQLIQSDSAVHHVLFSLNKTIALRVDAYLSGIFRLRFGLIQQLNSSLTSRAQDKENLRLALDPSHVDLYLHEVEGAEVWEIRQESYTLRVHATPFKLALFKDDNLVWQTSPEFSDPLAWQVDDQGIPSHWGFMMGLAKDCSIFGLGQTEGSLDRNGQEIYSERKEAAVQPFAWTVHGWGLYLNTWGTHLHSLATSGETYELHAQDQVLDLFLLTGSPADIFNQYATIVGRSGQVPLWALGVTVSQQADQSDEIFLDQANQLRKSGYPIDLLHFRGPSFVRMAEAKNVVEWDEQRHSVMAEFLQKLQAQNFQACIPSLPFVLVNTPLFDNLEDRAFLLQDEKGAASVFSGKVIGLDKDFALLDLTHKDARRLWADWHKEMSQQLVGAFDLRLPVSLKENVYARNGETGVHLELLYQLYLENSIYEAVANHKVPAEAVLFNGKPIASSQRYPWHRVSSDKQEPWAYLEQVIRRSITLQNSGQLALYHDWSASLWDKADTEFTLRLLAYSICSAGFTLPLCSRLLDQLHGESQAIALNLLRLRYRLIPYISGLIEDNARSGLPVQRSMALSFPEDSHAHLFGHQYMFGQAVLVAPVFKPGQEKTVVYLPKGQSWWDLNTGTKYEGGQLLQFDSPTNTVLAFGREGHMLCVGSDMNHTGDFNSSRILEEVWMFGMPEQSPLVMRNKIRVMQMQGSSYIKGLEGLRILQPQGLEVKRRGAEVRISRER